MKSLLWSIAVFAAVFFPESAGAQSATAKEYQVKAVFLFHFAQFVEWPADSSSPSDRPLVIGVLGEDPFGAYLDAVVRNEKIGTRAILVKRYAKIEDVNGCNILFISGSNARRMEQVLSALKKKPILTVGDTENFSASGGMIRFANQQTKIRLKINLEAVQAADLTLSSKLLRLADIVTPDKG